VAGDKIRRCLSLGRLAWSRFGEHVAINVLKGLRHRMEPQAKGVPLAITLGWYNISYVTFGVVESKVGTACPSISPSFGVTTS
jgi:hypothetical protein